MISDLPLFGAEYTFMQCPRCDWSSTEVPEQAWPRLIAHHFAVHGGPAPASPDTLTRLRSTYEIVRRRASTSTIDHIAANFVAQRELQSYVEEHGLEGTEHDIAWAGKIEFVFEQWAKTRNKRESLQNKGETPDRTLEEIRHDQLVDLIVENDLGGTQFDPNTYAAPPVCDE